MTSDEPQNRRRNLVLLRAGDTSIHEAWLEEENEKRNWDFIINYFGDDPDKFRGGDWLRIDSKGLKMQGLHDFIRAHEDLVRRYEFVWLPDEDLRIRCEDINRMFDICRERQLKLAQPSLSPDSYFSHPVTLHCRGFKLRYTSFVEIMAPCLSTEALWTVLPTMDGIYSGWGLDFVWPKLLSSGSPAIGIIDEVRMTHTRPVGGGTFYQVVAGMGQSAWNEMKSIEARYGIEDRRYEIHGGILDSGRPTESRALILWLYLRSLIAAAPRMKSRPRQRALTFMSAIWQQIKGRRKLGE